MPDDKLFSVYMMADHSRVLYVGVTSDLYQRVQQHRKSIFEGFTSRYTCNRLVWFERFTGPNEAIAREKQIKRWRRAKKGLPHRDREPYMARLGSRLGLTDSTLRRAVKASVLSFRPERRSRIAEKSASLPPKHMPDDKLLQPLDKPITI